MARAYADGLRFRILSAYEQNEGTCAELADRFRVSVGYVEKIRGQQLRTSQKERRKHRPGRKPKFTEPVREQQRTLLVNAPPPDFTIAATPPAQTPCNLPLQTKCRGALNSPSAIVTWTATCLREDVTAST